MQTAQRPHASPQQQAMEDSVWLQAPAMRGARACLSVCNDARTRAHRAWLPPALVSRPEKAILRQGDKKRLGHPRLTGPMVVGCQHSNTTASGRRGSSSKPLLPCLRTCVLLPPAANSCCAVVHAVLLLLLLLPLWLPLCAAPPATAELETRRTKHLSTEVLAKQCVPSHTGPASNTRQQATGCCLPRHDDGVGCVLPHLYSR
jgi:hypothetical protein